MPDSRPIQASERRYDGTGRASPQWWPSRYGAEDQAGTGNELTPERVLAALRIPSRGEVIELAQLLEPGIPAYPPRGWDQLILAHGSLDESVLAPDTTRPSYFEEHVSQTYQIGCHLDALGHLGIDGRFYNGHHYKDIYEPTGLTKLGIEHARPWLAKGVCLDIAGLVGEEMLTEGFAIDPDHLAAACERQEVEIGAGDVVVVHTGWSKLWNVDNERYGALEPGLGWEAGHWLTDRRISLAAADNWCLEVWPPEKEDAPLAVHQHLLAETGTYILENIKTQELIDGGVSEFLFVLSPNRTKGSTGSMASPLAVV
ncbi:MAG TPA: cyclase family protein [Solirubrobacterales bacterium]|nr:cyclase family protein [Solirubrobacterales bacterium]